VGFQVRVQNFQSILDQALSIDGLTVITGTNNSGKTAVMRAIRGVFTNAPAGALVRHGCAHLTVTLTFHDGTTLKWEKGWEKPGKKGKTINQYTINGKQIGTVGRGVPPEVEALGVHSVQAASASVWPQIANQFGGALFLVDRPGSAVAEALSDVERVGKLTSALKSSEKDRRSANAELKVRRKDVSSYKEEVSRYDGLDPVADQITGLQAVLDQLAAQEHRLEEARRLRVRHQHAQHEAWLLEGFDPSVIPSSDQVTRIMRALQVIRGFHDRHTEEEKKVQQFSGFEAHTPPSGQMITALASQISALRGLVKLRKGAFEEVSFYIDLPVAPLPGDDRLRKITKVMAQVSELRDRHIKALALTQEVTFAQECSIRDLAQAQDQVKDLLGHLGVCPTCNTLHEGDLA
jgi:DNA repair exonuclease SbcCD ATPase subunit